MATNNYGLTGDPFADFMSGANAKAGNQAELEGLNAVQNLGDAQRVNQNPYAQIAMDPAFRSAQLSALSRFGDISSQGGQDAQFRAQQAQMQNDLAQQERASREANLSGMAQRGMAGSGAQLANNLSSIQGGAQSGNMGGLQNMANAQNRQMSALQSYGNLGSNLGNQNMQNQLAQAQGTSGINQFNAGQANQYNLNRAGLQNQALSNFGQQQNRKVQQGWENVGNVAQQGGRAVGTIFGGPAGGMFGGLIGSSGGSGLHGPSGGYGGYGG